MIEGLRGYIQLASGLTDVTRERALAAARAMVSQGGAGVDAVVPSSVKAQVGALTDDLVATGKANRALLVGLMRTEAERATARLGLTWAAERDAAERRVERLEERVGVLEAELAAARVAAAGGSAAAKKAGAKKAATKRAARKTAKKTTAKRTTAKKSTATTGSATTASATPTPAPPSDATPSTPSTPSTPTTTPTDGGSV